MPVTPDGVLSVPIDKARDLVAGSSTFQSWIGITVTAQAKNRVYPFGKPRSGIVYPFVIVGWMPSGQTFSLPTREFVKQNQLFVAFWGMIRAQHGEPDDTYEFSNRVGNIVSEMWTVSNDGTVDRANVLVMDLIDGPMYESEDLNAGENSNVMVCRYLLTTGVGN